MTNYCDCFCHKPRHENAVVSDYACGCNLKKKCLIKESEMSGCHPTELRCKHGRVTNCLECDPIMKLPSCKHGLVSRCLECDSLEKRLDKLESLLDIKKIEQILLDGANLHLEIMRLSKKLEDTNKECDLDERIEALERKGIHVCVSHYSEILDKVQELEERIKEAKAFEKDGEYAINDLRNRVEVLESKKLGQELDPKVWVFVNERLDKIERSILETRIQFINQLGNEKKPFKCPVCQGEGRIKLDEPLKKGNTTYFSISCASCNEKGVVWG